MRFSLIRSVLALAIMLALISAPASAIKFKAESGSGSGAASVSGEYRLQDSASLDSDITLSNGVVSRLSSVSADGENKVSEGVSSGGSSVKNTIDSEGSLKYTSCDLASQGVASSEMRASQDGPSGFFNTISSGQENEFTVAGGFSKKGNMDVSLSSLATPQESLTTGSALALGTPCFSDELVQGIRGQDMAVSVQGLYAAQEQGQGEFGVVVQNAKDANAMGKPAGKPQPTALDYKLAGWKWQSRGIGPNIPIVLSADLLPEGKSLDSVKSEISAAQAEWDQYSSKNLFSTLGTITSATNTYNQDPSTDIRDGKNVHLWTSDTGLSDDTIAMTVTWANTLTGTAVESDCWYNNRFTWRIDDDGLGGNGDGSVDIRTIALHELGHTLGLDDLYPAEYAVYDPYYNNYRDSWRGQTMWGFNDGTADWTLNGGDIAGVQKLYGK